MLRLIVPLLVAGTIALSQTLCPPDEPGCSPWQSETINLTLGPPDCVAQVTYLWRVCNGRLEIALEESGIQPLAGCGGWDRLVLYHHSYSGLLDYITQGTLTHLLENQTYSNWGVQYPIPDCQQGSLRTASVYTAACGIWLSCTYNVNSRESCEQGYQFPDPNFDPQTNTVKTWKWHPCGQTCCKREYEICTQPNPLQPLSTVYSLRLIGKYALLPCSQQDQYAKPCEDGC
ncbi:MAG: hypothetical protein KatS3mg040_0204 [Candidatus Kapaibacterium sp.]|jgi:hypothetical protein|nr:MAG: hypothetical protein KatS3mg040_0204 [Candidatus Kapabacteria bacterium]